MKNAKILTRTECRCTQGVQSFIYAMTKKENDPLYRNANVTGHIVLKIGLKGSRVQQIFAFFKN